jgi:hypothetical protein
MGFFIKKIDTELAKEFFRSSYETIISDDEMKNNIEKLKQLKQALPLMSEVNQKDFDVQLTAVNIELLEISWTKYAFKKVGLSAATDFLLDVKFPLSKEISGLEKYSDLVSEYSQAFGSSSVNGFEPMAVLFLSKLLNNFESVSTDDQTSVNEMIQSIVWLIGGSFEVIDGYVKSSHLIW